MRIKELRTVQRHEETTTKINCDLCGEDMMEEFLNGTTKVELRKEYQGTWSYDCCVKCWDTKIVKLFGRAPTGGFQI